MISTWMYQLVYNFWIVFKNQNIDAEIVLSFAYIHLLYYLNSDFLWINFVGHVVDSKVWLEFLEAYTTYKEMSEKFEVQTLLNMKAYFYLKYFL